MQPRKIFITSGQTCFNPFFYIIRHKTSGRLYAGVKYSDKIRGKNKCDSSKFMTVFGYPTSSKYVKEIIDDEGLKSFEVDRIRHFDTIEDACNYEVAFLTRVDAMRHNNFINESNGAKSFRASLEARTRAIQKCIGKKRSEESKMRMSTAQRGRKHSEDTRKKMSESQKGRKHSEETKTKMSMYGHLTKGRKSSEETKEKLRIAHLGKITSEETKAKQSKAAKQRIPLCLDGCDKIRQSKVGKKLWNNTQVCKYAYTCPGEDWILGRL